MNTEELIQKVLENNKTCTEVKKFGEVTTPVCLVNEMLDQLPEEVWTNPDLKWLDPANGCGIFPAVIVQRLMKGLAWKIPDEEERYKHIVEKMLHVCELQPKNMFLFLCAFDQKDIYAMNIFTGSFLTEDFNRHAQEIWGVDKFDVIVGNPPYQRNSENGKKTHPIWPEFVEKSITLLANEGFLSLVHPSGWRNIDGNFKDIQRKLRQRQITHLAIRNEKQGMQLLGAETRLDSYCLKNSAPTNVTRIVDDTGETRLFDVASAEFTPNNSFELIRRFLAKRNEPRVNVLAGCAYHTQREHISKVESNKFKWPCIYTVKKGDEITTRWSSKNTLGHFGTPKLIWSNFRISSAGSIIDESGKYGLTQFAYAIVDDAAVLHQIKMAFDSLKFRQMMEACAVSQMSINHKIIALFRRDFWKEFID